MHDPLADYRARDEAYWAYLESAVREDPARVRDMLYYFPAYIRRREMVRLLAHYELFKKMESVPGCVVELGVYKGASFFTWTNLLETFCPGDRHRMVYGFDHFKGLEAYSSEDHRAAEPDGILYAHDARRMAELVDFHTRDSLVPGVTRGKIINGDILETVPRFARENPGLRISLLHFDADLYEPTKCALEHLYPLVVKGGVVCFDEYGFESWPGESRAADEYFADKTWPGFSRFPFAPCPGGWFVK